MSAPSRTNSFLLHDVLVIVMSVSVAAILVQTEVLANILASTQGLEFLGSFIAGLFFTSVFTTAPTIVTLGEIAEVNSILLVALFGAVGAVIGDLVIFRFVRDRFAEHVLELLRHRHLAKRVGMLLKLKLFDGCHSLSGFDYCFAVS